MTDLHGPIRRRVQGWPKTEEYTRAVAEQYAAEVRAANPSIDEWASSMADHPHRCGMEPCAGLRESGQAKPRRAVTR